MDVVLLETERLRLRRIGFDDLDHMVELDSDPEVIRYTNTWFQNGQRPTSRFRMLSTVLPSLISAYKKDPHLAYWAAEVKATGEFIGWFQFTPTDCPGQVEVGYRLKRSVWGQGYATEGAEALVNKGFKEWGVSRVVAKALSVNEPSIRVMEKLGLKKLKDFVHQPGGPAVVYGTKWSDFAA